MTVKSWERIDRPPSGWKERVCRPFEDYSDTQYVDSAVFVCDDAYYLALAQEQQHADDGKGSRMPMAWYRIEISGAPPDLYNRGGYAYDGLSAFIQDMMSR